MNPRQALDLTLQEYEVGKVLMYAQVAGEKLSPQEIGMLLGLSASEVGKAINSLTDMGYYDLGKISPYFAKAHLGETEAHNTVDELANAFCDRLNELTGKRYSAKAASVRGDIKKLLRTLPSKDVTPESLIAVVEFQHSQWKDSDMAKYLRPETLLRLTKFPNYLQNARAEFSS